MLTTAELRRVAVHSVLATVLAAALYTPGLDVSPPHLLHDEIKFALQAKSIADTGRDLNGRLLPVYFLEGGFAVGRDPICIYVTAAVLKLLPLSEKSIRLPSALLGAFCVGLTFILARLIFGRDLLAWVAAGLMALTPTYFIHSRLALSVVYPIPFTLLWLTALVLYLSSPRPRYAAACGVLAGLGVYSYLGAAILMPLYFVATIGVLATRRDRRGIIAAVTGFAVTLLPIVWWQFVEPDRYAQIVVAYRLNETQAAGPLERLLELTSGAGLMRRLDTFWEAFNPSRLFFSGESSLHISTRLVGSFLLSVAVFLALGIRHLLQTPRTPLGAVLLFGLVSAPLPAVIMLDVEIRRWLILVPFAILVATFGVERLLQSGRRARAICVLLLALMPLQFLAFGRDYFGPYRERASFWFGGNIRGALETLLEADQTPTVVYISEEIPWVEAYWRFYTTVHSQRALLERTHYVRLHAAPIAELPRPIPGAMVVAPAQEIEAAERLASAGWEQAHVIREPDGKASFTIYARSGT